MMVSSLDGRAAVAGSSRPLGGPFDVQLLVALRTAADAVIVGPSTVRAEGYARIASPAVLVSRSFDLPWDAGLFAAPDQPVLVYTGPGRARRRRSPRRSRSCGWTSRRSRRCSPTCAPAGWSRCCARAARRSTARCSPPAWSTSCSSRSRRVATGDETQPAIVMGGALPAPLPLALRSVATADGDLYLRYSV